MVKEIEFLQQQNTHSVLYVLSDLQENSQWYSVYGKQNREMNPNQLEEVKSLFLQKSSALEKKQNVSVVIIYQPRNTKEDRNFQNMVKLYQAIFQELEIPIEFKTTF